MKACEEDVVEHTVGHVSVNDASSLEESPHCLVTKVKRCDGPRFTGEIAVSSNADNSITLIETNGCFVDYRNIVDP